MNANPSRPHPAEWEETAHLPPPVERDLPAGRPQFHKERLMTQIDQDTQAERAAEVDQAAQAAQTAGDRKPSWRDRFPRSAVLLPVTALALAGAVLGGIAMGNGGGSTATGTTAGGSKSVTLDQSGDVTPHNSAGALAQDQSSGASLERPSYDYLATLTTDPDKLLAKVYEEAKGHGSSADQEAFTVIGDLLVESYPPAALYTAPAKIPGVFLVPDAVDATGRHGVAVARLDEVSGQRTEWIFDKKTSVFLGEHTVQVKAVSGIPTKPGTVVYTSAIVVRTIVDHMKQVPAQSG